MISASTFIRIIGRHISFDKFTNAPRYGGALLKFSTGSTTCVRNIGILDTYHLVSYENVIGCLKLQELILNHITKIKKQKQVSRWRVRSLPDVNS